MNFLFVALGGALGAVLRYAISLIPVKTDFPILTLVTNIVGAVAIGFIVGIVSEKENISPNTVLFWKTGACGGFTTFSTFSLEAVTLFENKLPRRIVCCVERGFLFARCVLRKTACKPCCIAEYVYIAIMFLLYTISNVL